jgi:hypothetical protein
MDAIISCWLEQMAMMAAVFATLSVAFVLGWAGKRRAALLAIFVCLALAVKLFLFEIYSPEYGFRMPWIQTELSPLLFLGAFA